MRYTYNILVLAAAVALAACENDDTDFSDIINGNGTAEETLLEYKSIEIDTTPLTEADEEYASDDMDYIENSTFSRVIYITYDGSTATVTGSYSKVDVEADGAHVTVTSTQSGVEYVLSGTSSDGSFKIYSENKMKITLDDLTLTNPDGAAINDQCGKSAYIVLADGTVNTLTDGTAYTYTDGEDMKGTLFSEGQIIFSGSGTLNVNANCRGGIVSDDYIVFRPGNVINIVNTAGNGVKTNDGVFIRGGVLNITASADGARGIKTDADISITGGRTTIINTGGSLIEDADTTGSAGIKSDMAVQMTGGTLNIKNSGEGGKGINCNTDMTFGGGSLNIVTLGAKGANAPKGIKVDGTIDIEGGHLYSFSYYSDPIDADNGLTIADGYLSLTEETYLFEIEY